MLILMSTMKDSRTNALRQLLTKEITMAWVKWQEGQVRRSPAAQHPTPAGLIIIPLAFVNLNFAHYFKQLRLLGHLLPQYTMENWWSTRGTYDKFIYLNIYITKEKYDNGIYFKCFKLWSRPIQRTSIMEITTLISYQVFEIFNFREMPMLISYNKALVFNAAFRIINTLYSFARRFYYAITYSGLTGFTLISCKMSIVCKKYKMSCNAMTGWKEMAD